MSLVLHVEPQWVSPYVFACFVTLREKQLEFQAVPLSTTDGRTRSASYLLETVTGRVPTLLHDGFALGESSAIVEYLEETFPEPPVLPSSAKERARCRQLMSWIRSDDTAALRTERSTHTMFYDRARTPLSKEGAAAAQKVIDVTGRLLRPGRRTIFDSWTIIDAELGFLLHRLVLNSDPMPSAVREWAELQLERPAVKAFFDLVRPKL